MPAPFDSLPARKPLVHCMTNRVADAITADVLLACGASPAMIYDIDEAAAFASVADALLLNAGTIVREEKPAFLAAARAAKAAGKPWVLDPVAAGVLPSRDAFFKELLALRPDLIRGNAGEILALAGFASRMQGVDSVSTVREAREAAQKLALTTGGVVAVTGEVDFVTDGKNREEVAGGSAMSRLVTGLGCSLSAICAARLACEADALEATVTALTLSKRAQEKAFARSQSPHAYRTAYIDALYELTRP